MYRQRDRERLIESEKERKKERKKEERKGKERKGKGRKGKGRKGKERKGKERKGKERKGKERKGKERKRKGKERKGKERRKERRREGRREGEKERKRERENECGRGGVQGMLLGLHAPLSAFESAHALVDGAGEDDGKAEGSAERRDDEQAPKAKRRKRGSLPGTAQAWFLPWREHLAKTHFYIGAQCWRLACQWCPEVFASVDEHAHRRWKPVPTVQQPLGGRRCKKVSLPTLQKMTVLTYSLVKAGVPFTQQYLAPSLRCGREACRAARR